MKKVIAVLLAVLLLLSVFSACSASGSSAPMTEASAAPAYDYGTNGSGKGNAEAPQADSEAQSGGAGSVLSGIGGTAPANQKMIFSATADIETTKFDASISGVYALMNAYGAFMESSYIAGKNYADTYYGNPTYRTANFTIRVPADKFTALTSQLSTLGNVLSSNTQSQNITVQFIDTESRLKACRAEETSLLAMLEKASTVEVILAVQSRLTDVRYEIESLTSTLKNWQNQVDYSTVALSIREVAELTEQQPAAQRTYWEQVGDGFKATLKGIGEFFKGLFKGFVIILPVLLILAVIAVVVIVILRLVNKKGSTKNDQDIDKKE